MAETTTPAPKTFEQKQRELWMLADLRKTLAYQRELLAALDEAQHQLDWQSEPARHGEALAGALAREMIGTVADIWRLSGGAEPKLPEPRDLPF